MSDGPDFPRFGFVFDYLDDVLIASADVSTHLSHLRLVLERFQKNGLVMNPNKCAFVLPEIAFLGHRVNASGMFLPIKYTQAVLDFPPPSDRVQLQRFLGLVNFSSKSF